MRLRHLLTFGAVAILGCSDDMQPLRDWITPTTISAGELAAGKIGVDHFQFYLRDASISPTEGIVTDFPQIGPTFGAEATVQDQYFLISTVKEAADIKVRLVASDTPPNLANYQFVGCLRFYVSSGDIAVDGYYTESALIAKIPKGDYSCFMCTPNGMDYDIFFVPTQAPEFGDLTP